MQIYGVRYLVKVGLPVQEEQPQFELSVHVNSNVRECTMFIALDLFSQPVHVCLDTFQIASLQSFANCGKQVLLLVTTTFCVIEP